MREFELQDERQKAEHDQKHRKQLTEQLKEKEAEDAFLKEINKELDDK